jgi:hypothetical protein
MEETRTNQAAKRGNCAGSITFGKNLQANVCSHWLFPRNKVKQWAMKKKISMRFSLFPTSRWFLFGYFLNLDDGGNILL